MKGVHASQAGKPSPGSTDSLGLTKKEKIAPGTCDSLGMKTNGPDHKPNGPAKHSASAEGSRKSANGGRGFDFC